MLKERKLPNCSCEQKLFKTEDSLDIVLQIFPMDEENTVQTSLILYPNLNFLENIVRENVGERFFNTKFHKIERKIRKLFRQGTHVQWLYFVYRVEGH